MIVGDWYRRCFGKVKTLKDPVCLNEILINPVPSTKTQPMTIQNAWTFSSIYCCIRYDHMDVDACSSMRILIVVVNVMFRIVSLHFTGW